MTITDIVNRFIFYATDSKDVNYDPASKKPSFFLCNVEDIQQAIKNGITFPCIILQVPVFDKEGDTDNITEHVEGSFMILKPVKNGDIMGRMNVYDECKLIADQVINHMIQDAPDYFDGAQVKTAEGSVGPLVDQVYGWGVNFGFAQGYDGELDPEKWRTVA
jgi:hypothetical protein